MPTEKESNYDGHDRPVSEKQLRLMFDTVATGVKFSKKLTEKQKSAINTFLNLVNKEMGRDDSRLYAKEPDGLRWFFT